MKRLILLEILKKIQSTPDYKRKFKIFLAVFSVIFFITTGLVIWGAVKLTSSAINFAQNISLNLGASPPVLLYSQGENSESSAPPASFGNFHLGQCWGAALALGDWQVWLLKPLSENFNFLTSQCFPKAQLNCQGENCEKTLNQKQDEWTRI